MATAAVQAEAAAQAAEERAEVAEAAAAEAQEAREDAEAALDEAVERLRASEARASGVRRIPTLPSHPSLRRDFLLQLAGQNMRVKVHTTAFCGPCWMECAF